jgi:hypothetical protein
MFNDDKPAIVDWVIGTVLSKNEMESIFNKGFDPKEIGMTKDQFNSLSRKKQYEEFEKGFAITGINFEKMPNNSFNIQSALERQILRFAKMPHCITSMAKRFKPLKFLS